LSEEYQARRSANQNAVDRVQDAIADAIAKRDIDHDKQIAALQQRHALVIITTLFGIINDFQCI
jgi:hypothetical protein